MTNNHICKKKKRAIVTIFIFCVNSLQVNLSHKDMHNFLLNFDETMSYMLFNYQQMKYHTISSGNGLISMKILSQLFLLLAIIIHSTLPNKTSARSKHFMKRIVHDQLKLVYNTEQKSFCYLKKKMSNIEKQQEKLQVRGRGAK